MGNSRSEHSAANINYLSDFMHGLREDEARLREIQTIYDNLTLLGQLLCAGTDITPMRTDFKDLADVLLTQLAQELRKKAVLGLRSNARVAIDILIRNLFERTADIGFLATDSNIRSYAERAQASNAVARNALHARFGEYIRKYSVYHNIILLAPDGKVLLQFDESNPVSASSDPLIAESLSTEQAYVETFRSTDLLPGEDSPLIYSYRVMSEDLSHPVGVLCLCFRFQDECQRIFRSLQGDEDWTVITLLAPDGKIIASSDPYQFPLGARLERAASDECRVARFAGREYLTTSCETHGYQGYRGPGWVGQALAPLNHAFEISLADELEDVPKAVLAGVLATTTLFSPELRDIPLRAASIQRELNRTVWNGNVWLSRDQQAQNSSFAKVLLWEIGSAGVRTRSVFGASTTNLYETVVSSVLTDCLAQAALAMDIMDRNLYERANDCRWWALTGAFQEALARGGETQRDALTAVLRAINGLYTVYSNLLVFDATGRVVAVANPAYNDMIGQPLAAEWTRQTLGLRDSQSYCVSPFTTTPIYANLPTYVYSAVIRDSGDDPLGGIAIVFDSAPQFIAMLEDALPRKEDGGIVDGAFALFTESDGRVIASTNPDLTPGCKVELGREFFTLERGGSYANVVEFDGRYYAIGSRLSAGYREYKSETESYRNDVVALVFVPLSERLALPHELGAARGSEHAAYAKREAGGDDAVEVATFYIGDNWYGVRSNCVIEAIDADNVTQIPGMPAWARGCIMHDEQPITVFDLGGALNDRPTDSAARQIVVIERPDQRWRFGILVDELGEIPEIPAQRIEPIPGMLASGNSLTESLVKPPPGDGEKRILIILSIERIMARLNDIGRVRPEHCAA
ncbi:MAG: chemotaxis protein CheW [Proteobacteria bacterium]|nr:chemotaxis protein CheW [Pseudomonadota bacterium]